MSNPVPSSLKKIIHTAQELVVLTGAGISADSGIPTFRDAQTGMWSQYDPQDLATPDAFNRHPRTVLRWYQWRRSLIDQAEPNAAHKALAQFEIQSQERNQRFTLITQNIDNLHQQAGSKNIIELHGNIYRYKCAQCHRPAHQPIAAIDEHSELPRCESCPGILRPDVVWFGENLPTEKLQRAFKVTRSCDLFLSIGTSSVVQPAASLPLVAADHQATLVEINPQTTPITAAADYAFKQPAAEFLPELLSG